MLQALVIVNVFWLRFRLFLNGFSETCDDWGNVSFIEIPSFFFKFKNDLFQMDNEILLFEVFFRETFILIQKFLDVLFQIFIFLNLRLKLFEKLIVVWLQKVNLGIWIDKNTGSWRDFCRWSYFFYFRSRLVLLLDLALGILISFVDGATRVERFDHVWIHNIFVFLTRDKYLFLILNSWFADFRLSLISQ